MPSLSAPWRIVLLSLLTAPLALPSLAPAQPAEPSPWLTDYEQARQEARRTGKPLFVVFRCEH